MEVTKPLNNIKYASEVLTKALATVNEAHLANFSRLLKNPRTIKVCS